MRVFVTGATGLIGTGLVPRLASRGDDVVVLTRRPNVARESLPASCVIVDGDPMQPGPWLGAASDCDAVINLAGESIFGRRWDDNFKTLMRDSRVKSAENVVAALALKPRTAAGASKVLVNASAIGWYGPRGDEELTEEEPPGDDTLARLSVTWEAAARSGEQHGLRVAVIRTGVVLDKRGGALAQMLTPFKLGVGGSVGSGRQWVSWIHHRDIAGILLVALDQAAASGPINGTAPNPVTSKDFSQALGRVLHRPSFFRVPGFALRLRFGEVAEVLTTGQRVLPRRALALGYEFEFADVESALRDVLG